MNLEEEDPDPLDFGEGEEEEENQINLETLKSIDHLRDEIYRFKQQVFYENVSNDIDHDASDMGAMMTFHALYLQTIAYWIGLLDHRPVPLPRYPTPQQREMIKRLSEKVKATAKRGSDARTQVYSLLFRFSIQHPFELAPPTKKGDAR